MHPQQRRKGVNLEHGALDDARRREVAERGIGLHRERVLLGAQTHADLCAVAGALAQAMARAERGLGVALVGGEAVRGLAGRVRRPRRLHLATAEAEAPPQRMQRRPRLPGDFVHAVAQRRLRRQVHRVDHRRRRDERRLRDLVLLDRPLAGACPAGAAEARD